MLAAKQQSWKINIKCRANKFYFKFKFKFNFNFLKFSLFLKLHQFLLHLNTESLKQPIQPQSKFRKFKIWRAGKTSVLRDPQRKHVQNSKYEEPKLFGGSLASLSKSVTGKDEKRIMINGLLLLVERCLNKCVNGKARKSVLIMIVLSTLLIPLGELINQKVW